VHEGPQNLSQTVNTVKLEPGMLLTDEPGIYSDGRHGIRTENTLLVVEDEKTEYGQFLKFEVISYCPVDLRGIEPSLLTEDEREWLNDYHSKVYDILSPHLGAEERKWLQAKTMPVLTF
jgi:Xaa-Pro aminopeptidase